MSGSQQDEKTLLVRLSNDVKKYLPRLAPKQWRQTCIEAQAIHGRKQKKKKTKLIWNIRQ